MAHVKDIDTTRRDLVGTVGLGLTTSALSTSAYASKPAASNLAEDPTKKYPTPPFIEQKQPWPGLASRSHNV